MSFGFMTAFGEIRPQAKTNATQIGNASSSLHVTEMHATEIAHSVQIVHQ
jgi:hypothetical protein